MCLICGAVDKVVPYNENGKLLSEMYRSAGAEIFEILKPDCDHHPHGLSAPMPIIEFVEKHY